MGAEPARWVEGGDPRGAHRACVRGGPHGGGGAHGVGETGPRTVLTAWTPLPPGAQGCYQELNPPRPLSPVHGYRRGGGGSRRLPWETSWEPPFPLVSDPSGAPLTYLQLAPGWQRCISVPAFDNGGSFPEWGWRLPGGPRTGLASPTPPLWSLTLSSLEQLDRAACVPSGTWPKGAARLHRGRGSLPLCLPGSIPPCGLPSA